MDYASLPTVELSTSPPFGDGERSRAKATRDRSHVNAERIRRAVVPARTRRERMASSSEETLDPRNATDLTGDETSTALVAYWMLLPAPAGTAGT